MKKYYEFREGNGNEGNYYRCSFMAKDIQQAENIVRRSHMNLKRSWRRRLHVDGDDVSTYFTIFPTEKYSEFGASPYTSEIREITLEEYQYNLQHRNY